MTDRQTSTYSMWEAFSNCQRRAFWRYIKEVVPALADETMTFGTLIHECLATWYRTKSSDSVLGMIDANYQNGQNPETEKFWHFAHAMMSAYMRRYERETWNVLGIEQEFQVPLVNPATGWPSRTFCLRGKVDMIIEHGGQIFVAEHKTASSVDAAYIEGLNLSLQADIYFAAGSGLWSPVGVIYNILQKPALRKIGPDFRERCAADMEKPEALQRFTFYYDKGDRARLQSELWELSQRWLHCAKTGVWLQNRRACFIYRKPCAYFKLCASRDDTGILNEFYIHKPAHSELSKTEDN